VVGDTAWPDTTAGADSARITLSSGSRGWRQIMGLQAVAARSRDPALWLGLSGTIHDLDDGDALGVGDGQLVFCVATPVAGVRRSRVPTGVRWPGPTAGSSCRRRRRPAAGGRRHPPRTPPRSPCRCDRAGGRRWGCRWAGPTAALSGRCRRRPAAADRMAGKGEEAVVATDTGHHSPVSRADALAGRMRASPRHRGFLQVGRVVAGALAKQGAGPPVGLGDPPQRRVGR
jgi:hypothetical protein